MSALEGSDSLLPIAPGAKVVAKDWGAHNWASLLATAASRHAGMGLVMVGAADERALCENLRQRWAGPSLNLCGELTPRETAAALRRCRLLVCHDSGPMHLAESQGVRCVALFGDYNLPRKWFPFGSGHRIIHEPRGVRAITAERVALEIEKALNAPDAAPKRGHAVT